MLNRSLVVFGNKRSSHKCTLLRKNIITIFQKKNQMKEEKLMNFSLNFVMSLKFDLMFGLIISIQFDLGKLCLLIVYFELISLISFIFEKL